VNSQLNILTLNMKLRSIAITVSFLPLLVLIKTPSLAAAPNEASISIIAGSIKRVTRNPDHISFRIQVSGTNGATTASMSGNCKTGIWRVRRSKGSGEKVAIAQATGDQLLNQACISPQPIKIAIPNSKI